MAFIVDNEKQRDRIMEEMKKGDPLCKIPIGARVFKTASEEGDLHFLGKMGDVLGNAHVPIEDGMFKDAYLVHFDGDPEEQFTFIIDEKLQEL